MVNIISLPESGFVLKVWLAVNVGRFHILVILARLGIFLSSFPVPSAAPYGKHYFLSLSVNIAHGGRRAGRFSC